MTGLNHQGEHTADDDGCSQWTLGDGRDLRSTSKCRQSPLSAVLVGRYWSVNLGGVGVAGAAISSLAASSAVLDSGTSLLFASNADAYAINSVTIHINATCQHWLQSQALMLRSALHAIARIAARYTGLSTSWMQKKIER